jgi:hypothetical protein
MTTKPSHCQCNGCTRCSPERGRCGRTPGDFPGEALSYCQPCHEDAARVTMLAQPQTNRR